MKKKKREKINYFKFNFGSAIFLIGIFLFLLNLFLEFSFYLKWVCFALFYFGLIFHLILVKDRPFFKSLEYIKKSQKFIWIIVGIFFVLAIMSFFLPVPDLISEKIIDLINEILEKTKNFSQLELTEFIFLNNLKSSFFGMIFGMIFGFFSIITAVVNGYVLGFVALFTAKTQNFFVLWKLFPHGIFELPAVFISLGFGLKLGTFIFEKHKFKAFKYYLANSFRAFLFIIIPLLIIAAIIESFFIFLWGIT